MPTLNHRDIIETALRQVQEILSTPEPEREAQYLFCYQVIRELALVWGIPPSDAESLARSVLDWTKDVVLLVEKKASSPRELDLSWLSR